MSHLVQEHDDVRHAHLAGQQDVLARLRHRAVSGRHHQDRAVHLRRTRDHVLHVVGVPGAVHVRVVALRRSRTPRARVEIVMPRAFSSGALSIWSYALNSPPCFSASTFGDRRRQRRLAVVHVTNRAHVHVRLGALELLFGHA
jgi:hypothetical protein